MAPVKTPTSPAGSCSVLTAKVIDLRTKRNPAVQGREDYLVVPGIQDVLGGPRQTIFIQWMLEHNLYKVVTAKQ